MSTYENIVLAEVAREAINGKFRDVLQQWREMPTGELKESKFKEGLKLIEERNTLSFSDPEYSNLIIKKYNSH